jgi:hypothetical protein
MSRVALAIAFAFATGTGSAPMKFTTIDRGASSQIETSRTVAVRTTAEWAALWKDHAGEGKPPAVDFARSIVIAVFAGSRPTGGHSVEITRIEERDEELLVSYRERQPGPDDIVTQILTSPFHIVRTDSHRGRVTFQRER